MYNATLRLRQGWIRLTHWEYWPSHLINLPAYVYWIWLSLKARSAFFFNTANPLITNGGFLMESKKEIYDFMPEGLYPKTVLVKPGTPVIKISALLQQAGLRFPVIAKPDIGMRGLKVSVLNNAADLQAYAGQSEVDFLLQELIEYENEVGIFYCRLPHKQEGKVTGIVGKEFLSVQGDGRSTVATLLLENDRAVLQWQSLKAEYGEALDKVLHRGETFTLVPFGNHARGSKFLDWSDRIDAELTATFNRICNSLPEFYYGRLDVRFRSWEELKQGQHFSIIELNGAGSEPTHIYDPKHSIFFAWKEILRHLRLLYRISEQNKKSQGLRYMTMKAGLAMLRANSRHIAILSKKFQHETTSQVAGDGHQHFVSRQSAIGYAQR